MQHGSHHSSADSGPHRTRPRVRVVAIPRERGAGRSPGLNPIPPRCPPRPAPFGASSSPVCPCRARAQARSQAGRGHYPRAPLPRSLARSLQPGHCALRSLHQDAASAARWTGAFAGPLPLPLPLPRRHAPPRPASKTIESCFPSLLSSLLPTRNIQRLPCRV